MRVVLFIMICLLANVTFASEVFFLQKSSSEALELATKLNKPYFVFYCGRWCPTCKVMEEHTFTDDRVAAYATENFLAFKANIDEPDGKEWKERYGVYVVPTIIFFDQCGNQQDLHASTMNAVVFLDVMKRNAALNKSQNPSLATSEISKLQLVQSSAPIVTTIPQPTQFVAAVQTPVAQSKTKDILTTVAKMEDNKVAKTKNSKEEQLKTDNAKTKKDKKNIVTRDSEIFTPIAIAAIPEKDVTPNVEQKSVSTSAVSAVNSIVMTNGKIWAPSKRKKRKTKKNKREKLDIVDTSPTEIVSLTTEKKEIAPFSNFTTSVPKPTNSEADNSPTSVPATKVTPPKRKSIVLNPKKESAPTNIVIRTERVQSSIQDTSTSPSPSPNKQKVISMVTNSPASQSPPVAATNSNHSTSYLQLGYFENYTNANKLATKVRQQFYNNVINLKESKVDGKRVYRVTMSGFQNKEQLTQMKAQLKSAGFKSYIFDK